MFTALVPVAEEEGYRLRLFLDRATAKVATSTRA
jgi:hypothetical protein